MEDLGYLLKRAVELLMPQVHHYYKVVRKGKITKSYCQDGGYFADVKILRNDDSEDPDEPLLSKVELPVIWGGKERGIICLPAKDTLVDVEYYSGDTNFPRISNIRWRGNKAPQADQDELVIQQGADGTILKITADGDIEFSADKSAGKLTSDGELEFSNDGAIVKINNSGDIEINADGTVKIDSDKVNLVNQSGINLGAANPAEYVALATKVKTELSKIQSEFQTLQTIWIAHTHPTGVGPSGPPVAPYIPGYSAGDVAASIVKAK